MIESTFPFQIPKYESLESPQLWTGLNGSAAALALTNAATQWNRTILVITAGNRETDELEVTLNFYGDADPSLKIYSFPGWECLPYDQFSPHRDITSKRMKLLSQFPVLGKSIVVISIENLMQRLPPTSYVESNSFFLKTGQLLDFENFRTRLESSSYHSVSQVESPGEYVIRGGVIDVFPMGSEDPIRIDWFGDEIDTIRLFDVDSQLTKHKVRDIEVLPASEIPVTNTGIRLFRQGMRRLFEGDPQNNYVYRNIDSKDISNGAEFYLPLFFESTSDIFDYVPSSSVVVTLDSTHTAAEKFWEQVNERYAVTKNQLERLPLEPDNLFLSPYQFEERMASFLQIGIRPSAQEKSYLFGTTAVDKNLKNIHTKSAQNSLKNFLKNTKRKVLFVVNAHFERVSLAKKLEEMGFDVPKVDSWASFLKSKKRLGITLSRLTSGFTVPDIVAVITSVELFGNWFQAVKPQRKVRTPESILSSYEELEIGDLVVHEIYGIGRYQGLKTMDFTGTPEEYLCIDYRGNDSLHVPVYAFDCVVRYSGRSPEDVELHSLSSQKWKKTTAKARARAFDIASELLEVQALRDSHKGEKMVMPDRDYEFFVSRFPYRETPDQLAAIHAVLADLTSTRPMNRLVCGDVGFGKTEVALRAALVSVANGYQVVLVVPTTLLAQQHFDVFQERFSELGVSVKMLSRLQKKGAISKILEGLESNRVDIVIGTHRLLQADVEFSNLGLLIIDEEHRFGVRQKEHLKKLRTSVNILTLTATPIPRTLSMALHDICDISIIGTPPDNRLSVHTFVRNWNSKLVREACLRELGRGGQVIYLHNEVKSMIRAAKSLARIVPEANIRFAHGQMPKLQLQSVMKDFYRQKFDTLICTTIIENGIDIPSANTIIINSASKFGLAQLHQLRGRVGRSHHQAFAYLLVPSRRHLSRDAKSRLDAIESHNQLGVGYVIATHDLEIRGAGTLLGEAQSGAIDDVGYSLYSSFLQEAVEAINESGYHKIKSDKQKQQLQQSFAEFKISENRTVEIDLQISAIIPELWLPSVNLRLSLYKKIANSSSIDELDQIREEMIDRFGKLPESVSNLFTIGNLRLQAKLMGIRKFHLHQTWGRIFFVQKPNIDLKGVHKLINEYSGLVKPSRSDSKLKFFHQLSTAEERIRSAFFILACLNPNSKVEAKVNS